MKTLADEIEACLTPGGIPVAAVGKMIGADTPNARRAVQELNDAGRAFIVRRNRRLFLFPPSHPIPVCRNCYAEFERPLCADGKPSKRVTCSRFCHSALSWKSDAVKEKRRAGIRESKQTPEAMAILAAHNQRRWSDPAQKQKVIEQNRREWADPVKKAKRAAGIRAVHGSAEKRKFYSDMRKADWQKPGYRERAMASMKEVKNRPEVKAKLARNLSMRWKDPKHRPAFMAAARRNGLLAASRLKGKKQLPEQIEKRVAATKRTKATKAALDKSNPQE